MIKQEELIMTINEISQISKTIDTERIKTEQQLFYQIIEGDINDNVDRKIQHILDNFHGNFLKIDGAFYTHEDFLAECELLRSLDNPEKLQFYKEIGTSITTHLRLGNGVKECLLKNVLFKLCAEIRWWKYDWNIVQELYLQIFLEAIRQAQDLMITISSLIKAGETCGNFERMDGENIRSDDHEKFLRDRLLDAIVD